MGLSRRIADVAVAAIIFCMGAAVMFSSEQLGIGWVKGSPGSGYFPFWIGTIMSVASVAIAIKALSIRTDESDAPFVSRDRFIPVLSVLLPTIAYVIGIALVGIYVSSAIFMAGFMRVAGKFGWLSSLAVSIGTALFLFWLFELQFLVSLPKGPLENLLGY
ncbi:MAG TPA: tripartite tricarboxylate transporter TctB family protein [Pseudolabrys sp.]|jgi:hypothetical protein